MEGGDALQGGGEVADPVENVGAVESARLMEDSWL